MYLGVLKRAEFLQSSDRCSINPSVVGVVVKLATQPLPGAGIQNVGIRTRRRAIPPVVEVCVRVRGIDTKRPPKGLQSIHYFHP